MRSLDDSIWLNREASLLQLTVNAKRCILESLFVESRGNEALFYFFYFKIFDSNTAAKDFVKLIYT